MPALGVDSKLAAAGAGIVAGCVDQAFAWAGGVGDATGVVACALSDQRVHTSYLHASCSMLREDQQCTEDQVAQGRAVPGLGCAAQAHHREVASPIASVQL